MKLDRGFYARSTLTVAQELLGKVLVFQEGRRRLEGRIAETEAYCGPHDLACHAAKGRTKRTEVMFGPPGHAYVYLIYGMYHCLNFVTEREGFPAAVLIRALEPTLATGETPAAAAPRLDGPGRLCRAFGIDRAHNGLDLTGARLWVEDRGAPPPRVVSAPRIGVEYAGEWAGRPWRFFIEGSLAATRTPPSRANHAKTRRTSPNSKRSTRTRQASRRIV